MLEVRSYQAYVEEVFRHIGEDHNLIHAIARLNDTFEMWKNPDDHDYRSPLKKIPTLHFQGGELRVNTCEKIAFEQDFAAEVFSHEIRSRRTLSELGETYKRLKANGEVSRVVLHNIIQKMLWMAAGRRSMKRAA